MPPVPDLAGKVVSISTMDDDNSHDLADPRFEMQGGRLFVVGSTPEGASDSSWNTGAACAVAWDRVTDYFVFDSLERYSAAIKISTQSNSK